MKLDVHNAHICNNILLEYMQCFVKLIGVCVSAVWYLSFDLRKNIMCVPEKCLDPLKSLMLQVQPSDLEVFSYSHYDRIVLIAYHLLPFSLYPIYLS